MNILVMGLTGAALFAAGWLLGYMIGHTDGYDKGKLKGHAEAKSPTVIHHWPTKGKDDV